MEIPTKVRQNCSNRKLSETRGVQLSNITIPEVGGNVSIDNNVTKCAKKRVHYAEKLVNDFTLTSSEYAINSSRKATMASSPVGYTLSHFVGLDGVELEEYNAAGTPTYDRLTDSLDITIYLADKTGYKFSLIGGKLASAAGLLQLISKHLDVDIDLLDEACALWMVSDLLEVQLKPHHVPYDIRKNWKQFLRRFTDADNDEASFDEPLLMLRRNVKLSIQRECQIEDESEVIVKILYASAKMEILNGRNLCDKELSINLAALQMAVDMDANQENTFFLSDEMDCFFPVKHRRNVKTLYLFGIAVVGCKGSEAKLREEYEEAKRKYTSKHALRKAYLKLSRETPFYGAAFFRGIVERPSGILKELTKKLIAGIPPCTEVLVGIARSFITVVDRTKQEVLLVQKIGDCEWRYVEIPSDVSKGVRAKMQCFLLSFPDNSFNTDPILNLEKQRVETPERKLHQLLQVFSKQAVMMDALANSLCVLNDASTSLEDDHSPSSSLQWVDNDYPSSNESSSEESKNSEVVPENCNAVFLHRGMINNDAHVWKESSRSEKQGQFKIHSHNFVNCVELCLATFDTSGRCLKAQGFLRRALQEIV